MSITRRHFIVGLGALATSATVLRPSFSISAKENSAIKFGYAAITWGGDDRTAIREISEVGFRGIQIRSNILKEFGDKPKALRELLDQYKLLPVALSSGGVGIAPGTENDEITNHVRNAKFIHDVGGLYLQVTDSARPKGRKPETADFKQLAHTMNEIGKRAANDFGIKVGYHNHMESLGESPDDVDRIMSELDPRYVKLELDVAHYQQGGGDPVKAIKQYRDRLLFLHIKDVETLSPPSANGRTYRFVELGNGRVDLPGVFKALKEVRFSGWAIVELDGVPDKAKTPKECAEINKKYLEEKLSLRLGG